MTPDEKELRIAQLEALVLELRAELAELRRENEELREKVGKNSRNSSKPPSTDPPWQKPAPKQKGPLKRGAKFGHEKHERPLVPADKVSRVVEALPESCDGCGASLAGHKDPKPRVLQVIDIPNIEADVTEYHQHTVGCACGVYTTAALPASVTQSSFGPGLKALVCLLTGKYRLSKQLTVEAVRDLLNIDLSIGMVAKIERQMSAALAAPHAEACQHVRAQSVAHLDETGFRELSKKAWLWTAVTLATLVAVFKVARSRGAQVAKELLGDDYTGVVVSDRFTAYLWLKCRQLCWAHLLRDFQAMIDRGGDGRWVGEALRADAKRMFKWWHKARDGALSREAFQRRMVPLMDHMSSLLAAGADCATPKTAAVCREIRKLDDALFTFVYVEGVEPTNNLAERTLRPAVIWRKISHGTQSEFGSRYVERMLTAVATLRMQQRSAFAFLRAALLAHIQGATPPSLLCQTKPPAAIAA